MKLSAKIHIRQEKESKLKAITSLTIDDALVIHNIKIIQGDEKLFVAFPSKKTPDGKFVDIVHPITAEARAEIEKCIIDKYNTEAKNG